MHTLNDRIIRTDYFKDGSSIATPRIEAGAFPRIPGNSIPVGDKVTWAGFGCHGYDVEVTGCDWLPTVLSTIRHQRYGHAPKLSYGKRRDTHVKAQRNARMLFFNEEESIC